MNTTLDRMKYYNDHHHKNTTDAREMQPPSPQKKQHHKPINLQKKKEINSREPHIYQNIKHHDPSKILHHNGGYNNGLVLKQQRKTENKENDHDADDSEGGQGEESSENLQGSRISQNRIRRARTPIDAAHFNGEGIEEGKNNRDEDSNHITSSPSTKETSSPFVNKLIKTQATKPTNDKANTLQTQTAKHKAPELIDSTTITDPRIFTEVLVEQYFNDKIEKLLGGKTPNWKRSLTASDKAMFNQMAACA